MNLLVVGDIGIIFTYEYILEVASKFADTHVDVLSFCPRSSKNAVREEKLKQLGCQIYYQPQYRILRGLKVLHPLLRILEAIRYGVCKRYDVVNLHYIGVDAWCIPHYVRTDTRVIASIYGSDLLRTQGCMLTVLKKVYERADAITVASKYVREVLSEKFSGKFDNKVHSVRYGSRAAVYMHENLEKYTPEECKRYHGLPHDKTIILCGYNGSPSQRQPEIIHQLESLPQNYRSRLFLLFQCSYGSTPQHLQTISEALNASGISGKIVTNFMQGDELARFRKSVDVFLNLQPTDVLSATMIEELEAGAVVVKGKWLHYPDLDELGAYILNLENMESLPGLMTDILDNLPRHRAELYRNKEAWKLLSWDEERPKWERAIFPEGSQ